MRFKDDIIDRRSIFCLQSVFLVAMHMPFHCVQREAMNLQEPLNLYLNRILMKIQTDRGSEFVNLHVKKVLLKYNRIVFHSHISIKAAMGERLIRTIWLLISRYCTLKNTAAFIQDLDKMMLIYTQRPYRSLSNQSPLENRHINNTLGIFQTILQWKGWEETFNIGDTVRIIQASKVF